MNNNLMKKTIIYNLIWKFSERISSQLVTLIISIILARILNPEDYGSIALVMVFITIADVFVSNGLGSVLIQKKNADNLDFSSVFYINILISVIIYTILYVFAPHVARFYNMPILSPALRILAIRIPLAAINSIQQAYISRNMLFKRFFWSTLLGTLISGIVGISMAYKGYGIYSLIFQYLFNTLISTLVLWITVKWRPFLKCSWSRARNLLSYGWKLLVSGLLDTGYNQMRNLIIGKLYTSTDLAFYNQGDKYPNLIVVNINSSISSVLFPAISIYQNDRKQVKNMTRRAIQVSSYVMWPCMIGLAAVSEPLIRLVLTDKWLPCIPYLKIFCFTYGLWPIHTANLQAINALGRSDLFLKMEIIKKVIGIISLIISIQFGPLAIAFSLVFTGIVSTFINSAPNRKLLDYKYSEQIHDLLPPLLLAIVMACFIYPISRFGFSNLSTLILQVILGGVVYLVGSYITKQKGFYFCLDFLKTR